MPVQRVPVLLYGEKESIYSDDIPFHELMYTWLIASQQILWPFWNMIIEYRVGDYRGNVRRSNFV